MAKVSVVVAMYNAQAWLQRFVVALQNQELDDFEVLMIDDASTDGSAAMVEAVAATDPRFRLIRLSVNSGAGVARNKGIVEATGETICFADPDDLLPERSLEVRYEAYKRYNAVVRACHDEIDGNGSIRNHEKRPAKLPEVFSPADEAARVGVAPFLCAHWTWLFPKSLLHRYAILNGEGMRTAEDIVLLNRLFFHVTRMVWIPDTVYYWMKQKDSLSTTRYSAEHYANYFQCCDIFYTEAKRHKRIELADAFFDDYLSVYPAHLISQAVQGISTEADARQVITAMTSVAERHNVFQRRLPALQKNPTRNAGIQRLWAVLQSKATSSLAKLVESQHMFTRLVQERQFEAIRTLGWNQQVSFDRLDQKARLLRARYLFCDNPPEERFLQNGTPFQPAHTKNRTVYTGRNFTILERILWLPLTGEDNVRYALTVGGLNAGLAHRLSEVQAAFAPAPLDDRAFPPDIRALRHLARSSVMQKKFCNAWMFIDKDTEADDNAEHLYRWVLRNHPKLNAWFVLNRNSHDWKRLESEGFRLVPHGEMEYFALHLNCTHLISSQMDQYIFRPLNECYTSDFVKPRFVCLPHGVTKDDVSDWFNSIPFDLFVAATQDEARSITADQSRYIMSEKEVRLGGFPRYDNWLVPVERENIIFIMPTWRADLVGEWDGKGQRRAKNPHFYSSKFVQMWKGLFDDPRMKQLLTQHSYRVVFFAHPCFEDYIEDMPFPDFVEKRSKRYGSMIDIMRKSKVMITDFSSVAYDMAYMRKPVVYYQYENKSDFTRSQRWVSGYIDYETMGFGPVCRDKDALFAALTDAVRADGVMPEVYQNRAENTFAYHDARCCERAFNFIIEASQPFNAKLQR
ncbi:bifunctional glycosyltransferase/CDP-glycerol:glycerophosphate glycerophosphotransferase [Nitratidesulfovibrio liaohensis]|uniref:bifunctional glycosyltransferase/CDP-glycerol:glycerophosphate glycerophosphotransferase n=1 Tax=Nitratidesulfovibrio liaohensis TaxID=2604158 RepID=UPI00141F2E3F|nr:CDP-glycerol glycerophosphotransferase family protein [Nitratidesulfovibrio liaohensis]NHZ45720.1 glycosyltransferase [Nitratidesulfovibrio liaohensis]